MAYFIAIFDGNSNLKEAESLLKQHYANDHYQYHSNKCLFLIESKDISEEIAKKIGIKNDDYKDITGVVFKLNGSYAGYTSSAVWEWLTRND